MNQGDAGYPVENETKLGKSKYLALQNKKTVVPRIPMGVARIFQR